MLNTERYPFRESPLTNHSLSALDVPQPITRATMPTTTVNAGVLLSVFMTPRAMSFESMYFPGIASTHVFVSGYDFQMGRVNAPTHATKMV